MTGCAGAKRWNTQHSHLHDGLQRPSRGMQNEKKKMKRKKKKEKIGGERHRRIRRGGGGEEQEEEERRGRGGAGRKKRNETKISFLFPLPPLVLFLFFPFSPGVLCRPPPPPLPPSPPPLPHHLLTLYQQLVAAKRASSFSIDIANCWQLHCRRQRLSQFE